MSEYLIQSETLTGIADAIREKKGTSDPILVSNFAAEIESIQAGGGENKFALLMGAQDATLRPYSITAADWGDYPPTTIDQYSGFRAKNGLVSVYIPKEVTSLPHAFEYCRSLESVTFDEESTITTLDYTFYDCRKLQTITNIPTTITNLSSSAFGQCYKLEGNLKFNLIAISTSVFDGCTSINSIDLSGSTFTTLPSATFRGCRSIESISLPSTLTKIESNAFSNCGLTEFTIPESVTTINGTSLFYESFIETINFNSSLTSIGDNAYYPFNRCYNLKTVSNLENTQLTNLGYSQTFNDCWYLSNIKLPATLTKIPESCFTNCFSLTYLEIPASVTTIGTSAFYDSAASTEYYGSMYANKEDFIASKKTSVTISVSNKTFKFLSTTPPSIQSGTFKASRVEKIIVPAGCGEAYRTATNWTTVADKIEEATA